jgi:hypothetical protein
MYRLEIIISSSLMLSGDEQGQVTCCGIFLQVSPVTATVQCSQYVFRVVLVSKENIMHKNLLRILNVGKV